ncbi:MAG: DUF29 domain-containing protein [Thiotrichaceae bacterium]
MNISPTTPQNDFYDWIDHNITLLKQKQWADIDIDILIDELESMAKRDKRELISHFIVLIAHLLKWHSQPQMQSGSWRGSICEQRIRIHDQLEDSPSLKNYLEISIEKAYPAALKIAHQETRLPISAFPVNCPYSINELLDEDFYPSEPK